MWPASSGERSRPGLLTTAWGLCAAVLLAVARWAPLERWPMPACPMKAALHVPCATCGMTRAFVRMTHGDVWSALQVSPLGALLCASAMLLSAWLVLRWTVLVRPVRWGGATLSPAWRARLFLLVVGANWAYLVLSGAAD